MKKLAFISHSSADKKLAQRVAGAVRDKAWIDLWDLDLGDVLPQALAESIADAKWFVLLASRASMQSNWVRYELNVALVRWIEEADFHIAVIKTDDCTLHPELKPFLYADCSKHPERAVEKVRELVLKPTKRAKKLHEKRKRIVNRFDELRAVEKLLHEDMSFVCLWGTYGIGKTTLMERIAQETFQTELARFPLTQAHGPLRLTLELAARGGDDLPPGGSKDRELLNFAVKAVLRLIEQGAIVFFDDAENTLQDSGEFRPFMASLLDELANKQVKTPIFLASS